MKVTSNSEGYKKTFYIPMEKILFKITPQYDNQGNFKSDNLSLLSDLLPFYAHVGFPSLSQKVVFVYPIFTQAAYDKNGFYDYYTKKCDASCLTVPIPNKIDGTYSSGIEATFVLTLLNYSSINDIDIDKNPDILKKYDKVIVLHNEYVTKKEFDAITRHPDVIFLYPNSLYAEVKTDYDKNTITLVRGHDYPDDDFKNGFNWKYDNSKQEYNIECKDWNFYKKENYTFLNCYPEYQLLYDEELLSELHSKDPTDLLNDISNWLRYTDDKKVMEKFLSDYDIKGDRVPSWIKQLANMLLNKEIDRSDFSTVINYLYENHIIQ